MTSAQRIVGIGLPFAPSNWPGPSDNWEWNTGTVISANGKYYRSRSIELPTRVRHELAEAGIETETKFKSKRKLREHMEKFYSNLTQNEIEEFMESFDWTIPASEEERREAARKFNAQNLENTDFEGLDFLAKASVNQKEVDDLDKEVEKVMKHLNDSLELQRTRMTEKLEDQQKKIKALYDMPHIDHEKIKQEKMKFGNMSKILMGFCDTNTIVLEHNFGIIDSLNVSD